MKVKKALKAVMKFVVYYVWYFLIVFSSFYVGVCTALPGVYGSEPISTFFTFPVESHPGFYALVLAMVVLIIFVFCGLLCFLLDKFIVDKKNRLDYKKEDDRASGDINEFLYNKK